MAPSDSRIRLGPLVPGPRALQTFVMKAVTTVYRRAVILERTFDPAETLDEAAGVVALTLGDGAAYRELRPEHADGEFAKRLARGNRCFGVFADGRLAHARWAATSRVHVPYLRADLVLDARDVYVYDAYTAPGYRRTGVAARIGTWVGAFHARLGYRRGLVIVAAENAGGMTLSRQAGYEPIGHCSYLRLGPIARLRRHPWRNTPLPPVKRA